MVFQHGDKCQPLAWSQVCGHFILEKKSLHCKPEGQLLKRATYHLGYTVHGSCNWEATLQGWPCIPSLDDQYEDKVNMGAAPIPEAENVSKQNMFRCVKEIKKKEPTPACCYHIKRSNFSGILVKMCSLFWDVSSSFSSATFAMQDYHITSYIQLCLFFKWFDFHYRILEIYWCSVHGLIICIIFLHVDAS